MAASDDPKSMTADERLQAVAVILASGILRGMLIARTHRELQARAAEGPCEEATARLVELGSRRDQSVVERPVATCDQPLPRRAVGILTTNVAR